MRDLAKAADTKKHKSHNAGKPLRKNVLREVRTTLSRFMAIFAITALGAGFFSGLRATSPDMKATADVYYDSRQLMDFRLVSTMGFTQEDVAALQARDDVAEVMAGQGLDILVEEEEGEAAVRVHSLPKDTSPENPEYLNQLEVLAGRLPTAQNECVVDVESGYEIGDLVRVSPGNEEAALDLLATRTFTVVGQVRSPSYISFFLGNTTIGRGNLSFFMYVPLSAFKGDVYTELYLSAADVRGVSSFSDAYKDRIDAGQADLEAFGEERAQVRYDDIYAEGKETLDNAREDLAEARAEADEKLAEAAVEIADGEAAIADGEAALAENSQKLADAEAQIASGDAAAAAGRRELTTKQAEYDAALAEYNTQKAAYDTQKAQLDALAAGVAAAPQALASMDALQNTADAAETAVFMQAAEGLMQTMDGVAALLEAAGNAPAAGALTGMAAAARAETDLPTIYAILSGVNAPVAPGITGLQLMQETVAAAGAQLAAGGAQLDAAEGTLAAGKAALDDGWAQLLASEAQLAAAKSEVAEGYRQLMEARQTLVQARADLTEGKAEYEKQKTEAEEKFAEAQAEIDDGQRKLDEVEKPDWFVFSRDGNSGYSGFEADAGRIDAVAIVIPVFFFLVAALVCLTTMTRMVEEQRTQIGTMKALGYGKGAIAAQYIFYAMLASLSGAVVGVVVGAVVFPTAIWNAYRILYSMPALEQGDNAVLFLTCIAISVLCTTVATLAACYSELRSVPAQLMRPKAPKAGKRVLLEKIGPVWRHLSFTQKVTARNLFRYKKRFLMTVIGVAGCSALLLTGFGLLDSITGIAPIQFGEITKYDIVAVLNEASTAEDDTELNALLPQLGDGLYVQEIQVDVKSATGAKAGMSTNLSVAEDPEKLNEFIDFHQRESGEKIPFPQGDGVILSEKMANRMQLAVGESFQLARPNEKMVSVAVAGIMENYVDDYIYMTPDTYQKLFLEPPEYTTVFLNLAPDADPAAALGQVVGTTGVISAMEMAAIEGQVRDMMGSLNAVVWLIVISAGALAVVVLYNLININITERSREIATLKVLGFYPGEVAAYVYRESLLLTVIGIVVGLVGGIFLHRFVITTVEIDEVMFRRVIQPMSYVIAAVFTLACAGFVDLIMLRRLKKIDMVESLKSAE